MELVVYLSRHFKAWLLDVEFVNYHGKPALRVFLKDHATGNAFRLYDTTFEPYFYLLPSGSDLNAAKKQALSLTAHVRDELAKVKRVEVVKLSKLSRSHEFLKIVAFHPGHVPKLREAAKPLGETYEYDIPWARRWLIDKDLVPTSLVQGTADGEEIETITPVATEDFPSLRTLAFDIETDNPRGAPTARRDPVLMISYDDGKENRLLSHTKRFSDHKVKVYKNEKDMVEGFCQILRDKHIDVLSGYNSDQFDLPYLSDRARTLKAAFHPGRDHVIPMTRSRGAREATRVGGRVHFDVYNAMMMLERIGVIKPPRLTLEKVYQEVFGVQKKMVPKEDIHKSWAAGGKALDELGEYCRGDSEACYKLAQYSLPLEIELSRICGLTLFDASRATTGQLVETLFLREARQGGIVTPNRPKTEDRPGGEEREPIKGAYVRTPEPGVFENLAVLDFRSLYPSIIISHNVDPAALEAKCCDGKDVYVAPEGQRFCKRHEGLVPQVLKKVMAARAAVKAKMKKVKEGTDEYNRLYARQWSLKIVMNSAYGYLLYPRSRWYSRPAGEAVTGWARYYIQETMKKAEEAGFKVLYGDTDSLILQFEEPQDAYKVKEFMAEMNKDLPEAMELELEDFYTRGVFVSKKADTMGAKKKYALINREGKIKIRGFELVRRDWSAVARNTQRRVLEILLSEGNIPKAVALVKDVIAKLRDGSTPMADCVIWTQLRKKAKAYEVVSPELAAFIKAQQAGLPIEEGSVIGYIITPKGKTISEKAQVVELAKQYDPDYYIDKQVLPSVLKILGALGVSEEDIVSSTKQRGLGDF